MSKKVALVLSGGGAKGAFQVGAEKYARESKGYRWDVISGVSIGAINGAFLAMGRHERLLEIWRTVTPDVVFGPRSAWRIARRLLKHEPSLFDNRFVKRIADEIDPALITTELIVGAVSLMTGKFHAFRPKDPNFNGALLASGALPLVFPPVDISPEMPAMVDGGTRNVSPLGLVLASEPDEIVVINCSSAASLPIKDRPTTAIKISQRASEIAMYEIFANDVGNFLRMNRLVDQAAAAGLTLMNPKGRPFRRYDITIIDPDERLGETTDFSPAQVRRALDAGWEKARKVLG
ncbi:MAG TPA: patatin-like phospholipase family protein [Candidatus Eisenbacteria bacterium]|jgi:NTE family protein|nr:patatin-like phospholipase family protein [Candidatus Eisenbacteria bacterium]